MTNPSPPEKDVLSPDGAWRWDGTSWVAASPQGQAPPPSYPAQVPPPGYGQAPVKKKHTLRNVLLVLVLLAVLIVGGCLALVGTAANEVSKSIDKSVAADKEPGGPDNPLAITPGKAFEVSGFNYQAGWSVGADSIGSIDIKNLKFTNNRDSKDGAVVEISFLKGDEILATVDCTSGQIPVGKTATVSCLSGDDLPTGYDTITINDTF